MTNRGKEVSNILFMELLSFFGSLFMAVVVYAPVILTEAGVSDSTLPIDRAH